MSSAGARRAVDRFLHTDPADVGCEQAIAMLHVYAELVAADENPEAHHPGIAAHLRACGPCAEDSTGLLLTIPVTGPAHG